MPDAASVLVSSGFTIPVTTTCAFIGTWATTKPAFLVSTLMTPVWSLTWNQQPAIGHLSIIVPSMVCGVREALMDAILATAPLSGRWPRIAGCERSQPASIHTLTRTVANPIIDFILRLA